MKNLGMWSWVSYFSANACSLWFSEEYEDVACSLCKFGWFMDASTGLCTECGEAQKIGMFLGSVKLSAHMVEDDLSRGSLHPCPSDRRMCMLRSSSCPFAKESHLWNLRIIMAIVSVIGSFGCLATWK